MSVKSLGQVAFERWGRQGPGSDAWCYESGNDKAEWEAIARAVVDAAMPELFVVCYPSGVPVIPVVNPGFESDEGMLVYRSREAAEASIEHHARGGCVRRLCEVLASEAVKKSEINHGDTEAQSQKEGLSLGEFSRRILERCQSQDGFGHPLGSWSTSDWMTAVMGELGEAANVAKKLNRIRDGVRGNKEGEIELRKKLMRELADVFIYLDLLMQSVGVQPEDAVREVFNQKSRELGCAIQI